MSSLPAWFYAAGAGLLGIVLGAAIAEARHQRLMTRQRELLRLATEKREHNFKLEVDAALLELIQKVIKTAIATDMGGMRRMLDASLTQFDVLLREAVGLMKAERKDAQEDRRRTREMVEITNTALFNLDRGLRLVGEGIQGFKALWEGPSK